MKLLLKVHVWVLLTKEMCRTPPVESKILLAYELDDLPSVFRFCEMLINGNDLLMMEREFPEVWRNCIFSCLSEWCIVHSVQSGYLRSLLLLLSIKLHEDVEDI